MYRAPLEAKPSGSSTMHQQYIPISGDTNITIVAAEPKFLENYAWWHGTAALSTSHSWTKTIVHAWGLDGSSWWIFTLQELL
jgi:hypothetical protein